MAKKTSKKKIKQAPLEQRVDFIGLAQLLSSIQDRVTTLTAKTDKALIEIEDRIDRAWTLQDSREGVASKNRAEIEKFAKGTTDSMYALRDNTQKAFTSVSNDLQAFKESLQRFNERLGRVESRVSEIEDFKSRLVSRIVAAASQAVAEED
jgi:hypothetical protein